MTDSGAWDEALKGITQCSVCRGRYLDPRVLPCLHTFCLDCIQQAGSNRRPGNRMPCPLCRKEFTIPEQDFEGLQKDFRLQNFIEVSNSSFRFSEFGSQDQSDELMKLETVFCFDCQTATSVGDHFYRHSSHNSCDVVTAIKLLQDVVTKDERKVLEWESEIIHRGQTMEAERKAFARELSHAKRAIKKRGDELRSLVDTHIKVLENDLEKLESNAVGELNAAKESLDSHLLNVRRFVGRCGRFQSLKGNILPGDICRSAAELHAEAEKLERKQAKTWNSPKCLEIHLAITQLEEFLTANNNNIVGNLQGSSHIKSSRLNASMRSVSGSLWRLLGLSDTRIQVSGGVGLAAGMSVMAAFNAIAGVVMGLLVTVLLFVILFPLLPKTNTLRLLASFKRHNRHSCGVTYLRHRIYVIVQSPSSIVVFPNEAPFVQQQEIPLRQVIHPCDIASCHVTNSLYVSDSGARCVWKLDLDDDEHHVTRWLRDMEKPYTLSVSSDGRVITVREGRPFSSLCIYSPDAVKVASVRLPALVSQPYHSVETSTGSYIISHGTWITHTHGLVEVDRDGVVLRSYNSTECLWGFLKAITNLLDPSMRQDDTRHLAIDYDDRVFVADWFNDRIMQFDSGFRSHRMHVTSASSGLGWPIVRLCYVRETHQMLIVHETPKENRLNVYRMH